MNEVVGRRAFLSGAGKVAGVATMLGLSSAAFGRVVSAGPDKPVATPEQIQLGARADVLRQFLTGGTADEAAVKFPKANLTADQVAGLKQITKEEIAAVRGFRSKLQGLGLPEVCGISGEAFLP